MDIAKYPQYHLYLLTLNMLMLKNLLIPKNCDEWCVNASIINRAYYSAYLYCELWLEDVKQFKVKHPWDFENDEERIGEHKQVRDALKEFGEKNMKTELEKLFYLRRKADYNPFVDIESKEVNEAIHHMGKNLRTSQILMETIFFKTLKFYIKKSKLLKIQYPQI